MVIDSLHSCTYLVQLTSRVIACQRHVTHLTRQRQSDFAAFRLSSPPLQIQLLFWCFFAGFWDRGSSWVLFRQFLPPNFHLPHDQLWPLVGGISALFGTSSVPLLATFAPPEKGTDREVRGKHREKNPNQLHWSPRVVAHCNAPFSVCPASLASPATAGRIRMRLLNAMVPDHVFDDTSPLGTADSFTPCGAIGLAKLPSLEQVPLPTLHLGTIGAQTCTRTWLHQAILR